MNLPLTEPTTPNLGDVQDFVIIQKLRTIYFGNYESKYLKHTHHSLRTILIINIITQQIINKTLEELIIFQWCKKEILKNVKICISVYSVRQKCRIPFSILNSFKILSLS